MSPHASFVVAEQVLVYNSLAAGAFILWDHAITFADEVDLIWAPKFGPVTALFLFIRYLAVAIRVAHFVFYANVGALIHPSRATCHHWLWFQALAGQLLLAAVEALLIIRVFAFYERSRPLLAALLTAFAGTLAAELAIVAAVVPHTTIGPPGPALRSARACVITRIPRVFHNFWAPGLALEAALFALVAARFLRRAAARVRSPPFLLVFVRDGTWAFVLLFALLLWAALTFELSTQKGDIALTWIYSGLAFCGTRLTLNLRRAARADAAQCTTYERGTSLELCAASGSALASGSA